MDIKKGEKLEIQFSKDERPITCTVENVNVTWNKKYQIYAEAQK